MSQAEYDPESEYDSAVALVGMSGRFPGADSVAELWRNLQGGVSGLRTITDEELAAAGVEPSVAADPSYVRVGGPVAGLDQFDASAFGMNPREAESMEPQHRLFLECSWEALESAGYCPLGPDGRVGVFGGSAFPDYMINNVSHLAGEPGGMLLFAIGNERDSLTSLVSYKLGLRGPSLSVQTFCSTSLVAVHLACQSLLTFECDMALAGGSFLPLPQPAGYHFEQGGILSPDGRVRSFDAAADGSVMGSGVGVVALKRMTDAMADGDVIHAVILGSAVNNDGRERVGYTAPGVDGQADVIKSALAVAGVKPESVGYVECHATGTQLGDSIELAAMSRVFRSTPQTPCVLGSLKPSIGHLDRASGVAGLMRAALNLRNEVLPGTPGYATPNPTLAASQDRFTVLTESRHWPVGPEPRRAGVSSFGLGGTNAHVVLEQAPPRPARGARTGPQLLTFSAGDESALEAMTTRLAEYLAEHPDVDLGDVAYTLQVSRGQLALRRAVVVRDHADAVAALADRTRFIDGRTERRDPTLRLSAGADFDAAQWWSQLHSAATRLLLDEQDSGAGRSVIHDRADALAALTRGLTRLGVAVAGAETDPVALDVDVTPAGAADEFVLALLARLWQAGAALDWPTLHGGTGRRVELPTYPFQRSRYWVEARPPQVNAPRAEGRTDDPADWTYLPSWHQRPLPVAGLDARLRAAGPWLVLVDDSRGEAVLARLISAGAEVSAARPGPEFASDETGDFTVRPAESEDLAELLRSLFVAPRTVVHGFSMSDRAAEEVEAPNRGCSDTAHFDAEQDRGLYSTLALTRALAEDPELPPTELVLLTSGTVEVVGSDLRHPQHATLSGLAPSLAQENAALACRHIDIAAAADAELALSAMVGTHDGPMAIRRGRAWLRHYAPQPLDVPDPEHPVFRREDTVLITGGLGDVGLVLARHVARTYGCRLVLTARTALPPREEWQDYHGTDRVARHIRNILDLEAQGVEVLALCADVADEAQMQAVIDSAVATFGRIDVVVHGAGVQDEAFFGLAHLADRATCDAHLRAKVHGLLVLQAVLGEHAAERRITLSSVSAVLGGLALGPYSAANAALDAYAHSARLRGQGRWVTVNWDTWAVDAARLESSGGQTARAYEMAPHEGVDVFERVLAAGDQIAHVVVSTGPLCIRLEQWVTGGSTAATDAGADRARHPRPPLATPYATPVDGLERQIADVWAETLALDEVGANDNFFELGGHSLIGIQLNARLRSTLAIALPVTVLVEYPTVRQLAALIETQRAAAR